MKVERLNPRSAVGKQVMLRVITALIRGLLHGDKVICCIMLAERHGQAHSFTTNPQTEPVILYWSQVSCSHGAAIAKGGPRREARWFSEVKFWLNFGAFDSHHRDVRTAIKLLTRHGGTFVPCPIADSRPCPSWGVHSENAKYRSRRRLREV